MPFWRQSSSIGGCSQALWTFSATELEPGDIIMNPRNSRLVLHVEPFEDVSCIVECINLNTNQNCVDAYCFLYEHKVVRNGEIIYDYENPPHYDL